MPITLEIRSDGDLLVFKHIGRVDDAEFLSYYMALLERRELDRFDKVLVDLRAARSAGRSSSALREVAGLARAYFGDSDRSIRVAVVAATDISFGLARMYEALSAGIPCTLAVFRSEEEAIEWLG